MSDASMPHCGRCNRVEYDCVCTVDYLDDIEDEDIEDIEEQQIDAMIEEKRDHDEYYRDHGGSD